MIQEFASLLESWKSDDSTGTFGLSIPGLEIDTNDVRCTHGATAGPVDPMLKFYLMSRGIPAVEAERMIVEGFLEDALERIPDERIRTALTTAVMRRIPIF